MENKPDCVMANPPMNIYVTPPVVKRLVDFRADINEFAAMARVWCVYDPTRKCVDCELCMSMKESEAAK